MSIPDGVSIEELNELYERERGDKLRSMPFEQFFGEMDLSQAQKEKRIETAEDIFEFMRLAIASMYYERAALGFDEMNRLSPVIYTDYTAPAEGIERNYQQMLEEMDAPHTEYFAATHARTRALEIALATTMHSDDPYFYSDDRVRLIAENESNSIWNDSDYADAILTGKSRKTWHAIIDRVTRGTHRDVNGTTIPISEPFTVGGSLMMFPMDESMGAGPEEIVNCRCSVTYH